MVTSFMMQRSCHHIYSCTVYVRMWLSLLCVQGHLTFLCAPHLGKRGSYGQTGGKAKVDLSEGEGGTIFGLKDDVHEGGSTEELVEKEGEGSESDGMNEIEEEEEGEPSDEESREGVSLFMGQSPLQSGVQATVAKRKRKRKTRSLARSNAAVQMDLQRQEVCTI